MLTQLLCRIFGHVLAARISVTLIMAGLVFLVGCNADQRFFKERLQFSESAEETGSTHIAVLSVAPWADVERDLQANFQIDEAMALTKVLPNTRTIFQSSLNQRSAGLNLQPPVSTSTATSTTNADGTVSETESRFSGPAGGNVTAPGDDGTQQPVGQYPGSNRPELGNDARVSVPSGDLGTIGVSPFLQYQAANALLQEVRAMNKSVNYATRKQGYRPFLVRMQISIMPSARRRPYDAYVNLSFFAKPGTTKACPETSKPGDGAKGAEEQSRNALQAWGRRTDLSLFDRSETKPSGTDQQASCAKNDEQAYLDKLPYVVPLLVTDDLEGTIRESVDNDIRQFALGLALLQANVGANFDFESYNEQLQKIKAKDYNSLMTVARLSDNTLRIRLGAMDRTDKTAVLVPRTHNVSVLLLVPCEAACRQVSTVDVISATQFFSVINGEQLNTNGAALIELEQVINKLATFFANEGMRAGNTEDSSAIELSPSDSRILSSYVLEGNLHRVGERLCRLILGPADCSGADGQTFWTAWNKHSGWAYAYLIEAVERGTRGFATFDLFTAPAPRLEVAAPAKDDHMVVPALLDDGESAAATFVAGVALTPEALMGKLLIKQKGASKALVELPVDIAVANDQQTIRISRPSLTKIKALGQSGEHIEFVNLQIDCPRCGNDTADLYCRVDGDGKSVDLYETRKVVALSWLDHAPADPPDAKFSLHTFAQTVFVREKVKREVSVSFEIRYPAEASPVFFRVEGADPNGEPACRTNCLDPARPNVAVGAGVITVPLTNAGDEIKIFAGTKLNALKEVAKVQVKIAPAS
ncbi:hypothetical protein C7S18_01685 [Ahniella affigens]|uniref:Uncharacterized protein n=1 Tax=Ahniella affigens TaxID=2021234 RepID=A0A2P1PMB2_9GAMM|nr:hypothetical protein [Ahniella affigens]AVP95980.1 hypothetical protein C7S18_01685 [Ahniella affigens]